LTRRGYYTFGEFCDLIPDGQKADLLDGVIYVASPDNLEAAELQSWLAALLHGFVELTDVGKIYVSRVAYRLTDQHSPEPDIGFLPKELAGLRRRGYIDGPPALAIEIVSPDSVHRDYVLKRKIYEEAGVREYWIIDPDEQTVTFLCLRKGRFKERKPVKHLWRSEVLTGFAVDVRWFWAANRPKVYDVLRRLVGKE
jgi:Uma2 family endonuclease